MQSPIGKGNSDKAYDVKIRRSQTAVLPEDPVMNCIQHRSADFQGYLPVSHLEDLQVVKYEVSIRALIENNTAP
jgi:prolyl 4-hydroxylase